MYQVSEDSVFFAEFLENYISKIKDKDIFYLDMGTGSGIFSETVLKAGINKKNILAVDIDKEAVGFVKKKGFKTIQGNLFYNVKGKFDIITFNAPYLPLDKRDPKDSRIATTGGKSGDEVSLRFLQQAKKHLNRGGKIFLLVSSFTPLSRINKFKPKIVAKTHIFFEDLIILEID